MDVRQMVATVRNTAPASGSERLGDAAIRHSVRVCVEGALEQTEFDDNENLYVLGVGLHQEYPDCSAAQAPRLDDVSGAGDGVWNSERHL